MDGVHDEHVLVQTEEGADEEHADEVQSTELQRRARYREGENSSAKKKAAAEVDPAMDDLINATTRKVIGCFRVPARWLFEFDKTCESEATSD